MENKLRTKALLLTIISLTVLASCRSTGNTIVIKDAPTTFSNTDTTAAPATLDTHFEQLTIGENVPIKSFDPLFIDNISEMHAAQLLYEGLVRYDKNDKVVPAVAAKWSISNNQRTYRFTLRHDLFFHDSNVFSNGRGRRVVANDVKQVFNRMAQATVPNRAAQYFMDIRGFEPYYQEQHHVMTASERQLSSISGIETPNDSTIVFNLVKPDDEFLHALATPYAVIYPPESVTGSGFEAVGTGPFRLSQKRSDSLYIFSRFNNYYESSQPKLNRVDIVTSSSRTALLNALKRGDIQLIPQLGPDLMQKVLDQNGQLIPSLVSNYKMVSTPGVDAFSLRYNTGADISKQAVMDALGSVQKENYFRDLPDSTVKLIWSVENTSSTTTLDSLSSTYSANPTVRSFYSQLSAQLAPKGTHFTVSPIRVRNRTTPIYVDHYFPVQSMQMRMPPPNTLVTLALKSKHMLKKNVNHVRFNQLYWWIDLREATTSSTPNN